MRTASGLGAAAIACAVACSNGNAPPRDAGSGRDGTTAEGGADAAPGAPDAGDDGAEAAVPSCVGAAAEDASTICTTAVCVDQSWAQWPMPNSAAEVAQGALNPATYTVHGDGTVTDDVTTLTWQAAPPPDQYTWGEAAAYCASLTLGGHADWRVPAYIEIVSLVDYSQRGPAIDPTAFPSTHVAEVWTSTLFAPDTTLAWELYLAAGDSGQDPVSGTNTVRCVRGPDGASSPAVPPARYTTAAGVVTDTKTGLAWQQDAPTESFDWADAKAYCAGLSDAGAGWRVPTAKELLTLVDVTRTAPPGIDCDAFPSASAIQVWSATPVAGIPSYSWSVSFADAYPTSVGVSTPLGVRCVR